MRTSIQRSALGFRPFLLLAAALSVSGCEEDKTSSGCYVCAAMGGTLVDGAQRTGCISAEACLPYLQAGYLCQDPQSGALPPIPDGGMPPIGQDTKQLLGFHFTTVPAMPVTDPSALTITASVPYGTDVTALIASFVLAGKSVTVNGVAQVSEVTANDFTRPVSYVVTAMDGSTATYVVTVTASAVAPPAPTGVQAVAGFAQAQVSWTASDGAWSYSVYYSTSSAVSPTNDAGVIRTPPGSGVTSVPVGPLDIGTKYYFVVTADNGTLASAPSSPPVSATPTVSESMKQLLGFHFTTVPAMPVTDPSALTITASVPYGTDVTALVASFVLAGKSVAVSGVAQVSEVTANDFTRPVSYVVTAMDGSTATYVVTVTASAVAPAAPTGVQAVAGFAQAQVSWTASDGAWSYSVYYSTSSAVSPTNDAGVIRTPPGSGVTSVPVGPLDIGSKYYFVVTADNGTLASVPSSPPASATPTASNTWTWMSGYDPSNAGAGVYGTKGVADPKNLPPPRERAMAWRGAGGSLFLFGGAKKDTSGTSRFNDLWAFDGSNWMWLSGANVPDQVSALSGPGAREGSATWTDASGNFWLFGGYGRDAVGALGRLNDLWRFNVSNGTWTVVAGSATAGAKGVYGTQGALAPGNLPGARDGAVTWVTTSGSTGTVWLFGGIGVDSAGTLGHLNDLWKFDGTGWAWMAGANLVEQPASDGTLGTANAANAPGARSDGAGWADASGKLWLFGGQGKDAGGNGAAFNDLWKFDPAHVPPAWTWMGGSSGANPIGIYGTKGAPGASVWPGGRAGAVSWNDPSGNLWLFGGFGYASGPSASQLNDLWKFDGTAWTWVSGDDVISQPGHYGTKGQPNPANVPGARQFAVGWMETDGRLLMFGGGQPDLSELWLYVP